MVKLLYEDLSYQIRGTAFSVKKKYGLGHKEILYQRAFAQEFDNRNITYEKEKKIQIYSPDTGKVICYYQPDFLVEGKIIVELKARELLPKSDKDRIYSYLRNSIYELGFFINYSGRDVEIKRIIYSNVNKGWFKMRLSQSRDVCVSPRLGPRKSV